jgi:hypothetical protein
MPARNKTASSGSTENTGARSAFATASATALLPVPGSPVITTSIRQSLLTALRPERVRGALFLGKGPELGDEPGCEVENIDLMGLIGEALALRCRPVDGLIGVIRDRERA